MTNRQDNTDYQIDGIIGLLAQMEVNELSGDLFQQRYNKLIYRLNKINYNLSVHRTTEAHVTDRLSELSVSTELSDVLYKAQEEAKRQWDVHYTFDAAAEQDYIDKVLAVADRAGKRAVKQINDEMQGS